MLLAAFLVAGVGCKKQVVKKEGLVHLKAAKEERGPANPREKRPRPLGAPQSSSEQTSTSSSSGGDGGGGPTWAFALRRFQGSGHRRRATAAKRRIRRRTDLTNVWVRSGPDESLVYQGRYQGPGTEAAKRVRRRLDRLEQSRAIRSNVLLAPVRPADEEMGQYDLRRAASRGRYTLQIGFYEGEGRKQAAEKKARRLREEGTPAFYHHGPKRSVVTVGVFGEEAVTRTPDGKQYSSRVKALRKRFPWNRANGEVTVAKLKSGKKVKQPSFLVRIPETDTS